MKPKWASGAYTIKNPDKYMGLKTPRYRSSWEQVFMRFCDENPSVSKWASEIKPKRQTRIQAAEKGMSTKAAVAMNNAKWEAAGAWCRQKGIKFRVLTEDDIFHNPKRR